MSAKPSDATDDKYFKWFVSLIGQENVIGSILDYYGCGTSTKVVIYSHEEKPKKPKDGVYFKEGHWICLVGSKVTDSMSDPTKTQATSHLCQSFAMYNFVILSGASTLTGALVPGQYLDNSKKCATMLKGFFETVDSTWLKTTAEELAKYYNSQCLYSAYRAPSTDPKVLVKKILEILDRIILEGLE